ncbi:peptidase M23 [Paraburkholderia monticola]|uniref:Peptidase M23 n=1 Tax=Paraburkholderia monticola TaxID=1399968 RepID=A0A149PIT3_9BURK|nr:M23 family metallopeptidase [Paraburkholderia monticola]KXU84975.1 peptidase M23 [Paraburkholderia monticola]
MMRLPFLRHGCSGAYAISSKVRHLPNCRFKSSARAVLLCGIVALLGTSDWVVESEVDSDVNTSSETTNTPLSDAAPLIMAEADRGSYAGRIEGTLRDTLVQAAVPMDVQEQIARVFAPRLNLAAPAQTGDTYQVLYESDNTAAPRNRLTAVELRSGGKVYQAVWFVAPGHTNGDYYSFGGQRLAATPFALPLRYVRVSSPFGHRIHPVKGKHLMHTGVDFAAPKGTPVLAAASGTVRFIGFQQGYGNIIVLSHPRGYTTHYAHLSTFAPKLRVGAPVTEGQALGAVGRTGTATGAHLHFEVREHNQPRDPLKLTSRTGASPLTSSQRIAFDSTTGVLREKLAALSVDTPTVRMASNAESTANLEASQKGSSG